MKNNVLLREGLGFPNPGPLSRERAFPFNRSRGKHFAD